MYKFTLSYIVIYIDKEINSNREWAKYIDIKQTIYAVCFIHYFYYTAQLPIPPPVLLYVLSTDVFVLSSL